MLIPVIKIIPIERPRIPPRRKSSQEGVSCDAGWMILGQRIEIARKMVAMGSVVFGLFCRLLNMGEGSFQRSSFISL
jgi:hypothetical protein